MSDLLQVADLEKTKLHNTFHVEAVTGKVGGLAGGADIDFTTNAVTGQVQATLPYILNQIGGVIAFDFATGGTLNLRREFVEDATFGIWQWTGVLPHVVAPATDPTLDATWVQIYTRSHSSLSNLNPADGSAHNADDIADSNGQKVQDYLSNHRSDNSSYATTEQATNYTMTQNRHVFGEEYLWGFHKQVLNSGNTNSNKFIYSGDSTTAGNNAGVYTPSFVGTLVASDLGLARHQHVNSGHSGDTAVDWNNTWVAQDIANYPDMNVYIARWGINDGSAHGNVATYIAAMDSALGKLRAFKGVEALTIVVASPNSTYDDPNGRGTAWFEAAIPELRKICRKHMATFIDVYSIWQDAKQGALAGQPRWLDDPFGDGRGIHPDAAFNIQINSRISEMIIKPIMYGQNLAINKFQSSDPDTFRPSVSVSPTGYPRGMALYTVRVSDGWPANGKLRTTRNGSKVIQELFISEDDGTFTKNEAITHITRYGDSEVGTWSKWYGLATAPSLQNSWATVAGRTPKYTHKESGLCSLMGAVDTGVDGTTIFILPAEMHPSSPRTFIVAGSDATTRGTVLISDTGEVQVYKNTGTFACLDGVIWSAGA